MGESNLRITYSKASNHHHETNITKSYVIIYKMKIKKIIYLIKNRNIIHKYNKG